MFYVVDQPTIAALSPSLGAPRGGTLVTVRLSAALATSSVPKIVSRSAVVVKSFIARERADRATQRGADSSNRPRDGGLEKTDIKALPESERI